MYKFKSFVFVVVVIQGSAFNTCSQVKSAYKDWETENQKKYPFIFILDNKIFFLEIVNIALQPIY